MTLPPGLLDGLRAGDQAAVSRAITLVENERPGFEALLTALHGLTGHAHRVGITGPPGAGKSTLTQGMIRQWRSQGHRVGVVAVDPSSPLSGGALLGDRIRMDDVALDSGVFIRSMATRGALGGLALASRETCDVLDAAGYDRVILETVGVGQSELDVVAAADSVVLVVTPESGDGIQALKSGLMEVADLFVVNKSDRPHADRLARELQAALDLRVGGHGSPGWRPPVLLTAADMGEGLAALTDALATHRAHLEATGELARRRRRRVAAQTAAVVERALLRWSRELPPVREALRDAEVRVASGQATPYDIAAEVLRALGEPE